MKFIDDWAIADDDSTFESSLDKMSQRANRRITIDEFQGKLRDRVLKFVDTKDIFIDVGSHIGLWSVPMSKMFNRVLAFDVNLKLNECLVTNLKKFGNSDNVSIFTYGLSNRTRDVSLSYSDENTLGRYIVDQVNSTGTFKVKQFDGLEDISSSLVEDKKISLVKIDVEGNEPFVLYGMVEMLLKHKPVIVLEQKGFSDRYNLPEDAATEFLKSIGAHKLDQVKRDHIYGWV